MSKIRGIVEAKARSGKAIKIGEEWFSVRTAAELSSVDKGNEVAFEYTVRGDFKNIDSKTLRVRPGTPAASGRSGGSNNYGVELGHASNLAMEFILAGPAAKRTLEAWESQTKEIYERMKELRTELEQGGGHFGRDLSAGDDDGMDAGDEELDDDLAF